MIAAALHRSLRLRVSPLRAGSRPAASAHAAGTLQPWTASPPPALALNTLDGRSVRLDHFAGRTVLVNFWATWCAPCVVEMPSLAAAARPPRGDGVDVIAVNYQENAARIRPFVERLGFTLTVVRDHDGTRAQGLERRRVPDHVRRRAGPAHRVVGAGEIDWDDPRGRIAHPQCCFEIACGPATPARTKGAIMDRRTFVAASAAAPVVAALPTRAFAQARTYTPLPGELAHVRGDHPARDRQRRRRHPGVDSGARDATPTGSNPATRCGHGNVREAALYTDPAYGARMVHAVAGSTATPTPVDRGGEPHPHARPRHRLGAQGRAPRRSGRAGGQPKPTELIPTDGIVRDHGRQGHGRQDHRHRQDARALRLGRREHAIAIRA